MEEEHCTPDANVGWKFWKKRRYIIALMGLFGFFNVYALRANLSIAIVAMTENKSVTLDNKTIIYVKEFDWDSKLQGYILSSFFYGYILTQILGGWLAMRIGGKTLFGIGVAATAILTIITPFIAKTNVYLLIALRVIEGIFEGVTYPSMHAIWSRWAPPLERSRLTTLTFAGTYLGTVVSMPASGFLADLLGWPSIFYVFGGIGLIWYILWCLIISDKPIDDSSISDDEFRYITESLGVHNQRLKKIKYPWGKIFTSLPVWACIIAHTSENWGFYTFLTQLPKFLTDILDYNLSGTGIISALPYLSMTLTLLFCGQLADFILVKKLLKVTFIRKIFTSGGFFCQAIFLLCSAYTESSTLVIVYLIIATSFGSFAYAGFWVNYLDLAPQHASVLMGIGNTAASLSGIISPILSGYIVTTPTREEWQIVFFVAAGIYLFGSLFYLLFASAKTLDWSLELQLEEEKNGIENKNYIHNEHINVVSSLKK